MKENSQSLEAFVQSIRNGGIDRINSFVSEKVSENYFLDFKLAENQSYVGRTNLYDTDQKNYAKSISAFGNSEGGVVVWGVKTGSGKEDYAVEVRAIEGVTNFVSLLNTFTGLSTTPGHGSVENFPIFSDKPTDQGVVVSVIQRSNRRPLQSIYKGENKYYIRTGSVSSPAPHAVIAGMFGASPQPNVFTIFLGNDPKVVDGAIEMNISAALINTGESVAKEVNGYMEISGPGSPTISGLQAANTGSFTYSLNKLSGVKLGYVAKDDFKLGIEQEIIAVNMQFSFRPPFNDGMRIEGLVHSAGQMPQRLKRDYTALELQEAYDSFIADNRYPIHLLFNFSGKEGRRALDQETT